MTNPLLLSCLPWNSGRFFTHIWGKICSGKAERTPSEQGSRYLWKLPTNWVSSFIWVVGLVVGLSVVSTKSRSFASIFLHTYRTHFHTHMVDKFLISLKLVSLIYSPLIAFQGSRQLCHSSWSAVWTVLGPEVDDLTLFVWGAIACSETPTTWLDVRKGEGSPSIFLSLLFFLVSLLLLTRFVGDGWIIWFPQLVHTRIVGRALTTI